MLQTYSTCMRCPILSIGEVDAPLGDEAEAEVGDLLAKASARLSGLAAQLRPRGVCSDLPDLESVRIARRRADYASLDLCALLQDDRLASCVRSERATA